METRVEEYRVTARSVEESKRLQAIREGLKRGDKKKISERLGVHREWVSRVIHEEGTSERVLQEAERLIHEREQLA